MVSYIVYILVKLNLWRLKNITDLPLSERNLEALSPYLTVVIKNNNLFKFRQNINNSTYTANYYRLYNLNNKYRIKNNATGKSIEIRISRNNPSDDPTINEDVLLTNKYEWNFKLISDFINNTSTYTIESSYLNHITSDSSNYLNIKNYSNTINFI